MQCNLISMVNPGFTPIQQVLYNRGLKTDSEIDNYLNSSIEDINEPEALGEDNLITGSNMIAKAIMQNKKTLIIVDCDCDGYTSAAVMYNYLDKAFPTFANNIDYFLHDGKQHGLSDCFEEAKKYEFVIIPDAGSNDYDYLKALKDLSIDVLILDHHLADRISPDACVINNQLCSYNNKYLSGVGVVWQFCRYLDKLLHTQYSYDLMDLVALGLTGDMMNFSSIETKELIQLGFLPENIKNPFIISIWEKNMFKLKEHITPMGAAFYIVPFINAVQRSGTLIEKDFVFKSMLNKFGFMPILSDKRGHQENEMEPLVNKALRVCTNVKERQKKEEQKGIIRLEDKIQTESLLEHKVLLFLLEPDDLRDTLRGLAGNQIMSKYQRPVCVLTKCQTGDGVVYEGSARGYSKSGIASFKDVCEATHKVTFTAGHDNAFGIGIKEEDIADFIAITDELLKDINEEPVHLVDYIFNNDKEVTETFIFDIANYNYLWGEGMSVPLIEIKNFKLSKDTFKVMKKNTVKLILNNTTAIKFNMDDNIINYIDAEFQKGKTVILNLVCSCDINEFAGNKNAQLKVEDLEIIDSCYNF